MKITCDKKYHPPTAELLSETLKSIRVMLGTGECDVCDGCQADQQMALRAIECALRGHSYVDHWEPVVRRGHGKKEDANKEAPG